jgi:A/G-specific adenine glycosylase
LDWYRRAARDLPWRSRSRPEPYAVWLSEVMLQQTQVATVCPYYERFLARFPGIADLAAAPEEELLAAWQGLGYYRRARQLQAAAQHMVREHGGRFPDELVHALALPGVGRYTAGAVLSIAYGQPHPAVDGNVARVLARLSGEEGRIESGPALARLWALAAALVPRTDPGAWTQALMELGALVCTPRRPQCSECPVEDVCAAAATGRAEAIPAPRRRRTPAVVQVAAALLRPAGVGVAGARAEDVAMLLRPEGQALAGFYELPAVDLATGDDSRVALAARLTALGVRAIQIGDVVARVEHTMWNRRALITAYAVRARWSAASPLVQFAPDELGARPITTATRKILRAIVI